MPSILIHIINMDPSAPWIPAEAAAARLGVTRQTLYAYVSRGLLRARPAPGDPRRGLYDAADIETLRSRARGRARADIAAAAIDFGTPVLTSAVTAIAAGRPHYRGHDAIALAETATLEQTAALLWEQPFPALAHSDFIAAAPAPAALPGCLVALAALPAQPIWNRRPAALATEAAILLRRITETCANRRAAGPAHQTLAAAWGQKPTGAELLRRALVLCADHELNASTFAVRVVASTGAALPLCLMAGLAALGGPLHGGMTERIRAALADPALAADPARGVAAQLARGEKLPGFGHRLYPVGDPRATALFAALAPGTWWTDLLGAVAELTGARPTIDVALVALERELRLPQGAALAIFAAGRTAGWIAHALEQAAEGSLIRPRARYTGPGVARGPRPTPPPPPPPPR